MCDVKYGYFVVDYRKNKEEKEWVRLTVGGERINYHGEVATPTVDLLTVKLMINSVISTTYAQWMTVDIKNFYLNTPLRRYKYLKLWLTDLPEDFIDHFNLQEKATADGFVHVNVRKGMYGLPQVGLLVHATGYKQSTFTPGLWMHESRPIQFTLVVVNFGVKYMEVENALHLIDALKKDYSISEDWSGSKYVGLTLDWDYKKKQVPLTMPNYVEKALKRFGHEKP